MTGQSMDMPNSGRSLGEGGRTLFWSAALIASIVLHGSVAATLLQRSPDIIEATEEIGIAVTIELAPMPVAETAEESGDPAPDAPDAAPAEATPPAPEVEEKLSTESESDQPKAEPTPYDSPPDSLAKRETEKKDDNKPQEEAATDESKKEQAAPAAASAPSVSGSPVSRDDETTAAPKEGSTLQAHETPASWQKTLMRHLGRNKRYPRQARARRAEGTVNISFDITPGGLVLNAKIDKSSGVSILDEEALSMLKRAQPMPKLPRTIEGRTVHVSLPVRYRLK